MKLKIYILFLFAVTTVFGQAVSTSIDTTQNKIGAQFTLTLKAKAPSNSIIIFPKNKSFGKLEVIESYPIDTIKEDDTFELIKKYGLTQFDSGKYVVPRLPVIINKKIFLSDSIGILVQDVKVDTLKQKMYDIKPIMQVKPPSTSWWIYIIIAIIIIGLAFLGYWLYNKYKKQEVKEIVYNSPIEKAISLLQLLEKKELVNKGEIKEYYSELTDITRDYIEEVIEIPAKESTTAELITALRETSTKKKLKVTKETLINLEKVLKQADLVKFAKVKPLDFEIEADKERIQKTILTLDKVIPVVVDETSKKWEQQQLKLKLKQEKNKKKRAIVATLVGIIILVIAYTIYIKGFDYVSNGFSGYSTKELLNKKWIKSEYGTPSIIIETPEVLTRVNTTKEVQSNPILKNEQLFIFGEITKNFFVALSTTEFKEKKEINLEEALDSTLKKIEQIGAKNIISKKEDFSTEQGIKGIKAFGTFQTMQNQKMYYEILLFSQSGGLQQIMISHQEGNENAQKITERIFTSVELKLAN